MSETVDPPLIDNTAVAWLTNREVWTAGTWSGKQQRQETEMIRRTWVALAVGLLFLLLLSVFAQVWILPSAVERVVAVFPEVEPLTVPAIVWGICAIACWQAIAAIGLRLVVSARDHKVDSSASTWLYAMVACLLAFIVLVVAAFIALNVLGYATPGVMLGLIAGGFGALAAGALVLFLGTRPAMRRYSHT